MKKLIIALFIAVSLLIGYLAGNIFPLKSNSSEGLAEDKKPFSLFQPDDQGIKGEDKLQVILEMEDTGNPLNNVEVNLAKEPGQPPLGGTALSDEKGIATFNIKSGNYFIFFNSSNFPGNLQIPEPRSIEVKSGEVNQITLPINLK